MSNRNWPVTFESHPAGAKIVITNSRGQSLFEGNGPATLTLPSGQNYFTRATYTVEASLPGRDPSRATLTAHLNQWYLGNVVFGGLLGLLIVDPATGAMWKLDDRLVVDLTEASGGLAEPTLEVVAIDQLPQDYRAHLIRVK